MKSTDSWGKASQFFQMVCIFGAASLLLWCYSEYCKNEDVVEVSFKKYGKDEDSIYPDISLCFDHPFIEEKLKLYDIALTNSLYALFLTGQDFNGKWNEKVFGISYENISLRLKDHVIGNALLYPAKSSYELKNNIAINNFTVMSGPTFKCFTFHLPTQTKLLKFAIALRNSIFPTGKRPKSGFDVALHYPQQIVRSWQFVVRNWPIRTSNSGNSYQMDINVKDVEILWHRNKRNNPCSSSTSYDNDTFKEIVDSVGCVPPYMEMAFVNSFPPCKTKNDLLHVATMLVDAVTGAGKYEHSIPPCKEIQRIGVDVEDTDFNISKIVNGNDLDVNLDIPFINESWISNGLSDDFFVLNINFQGRTFKEIKQVRAYSAQTLVGNAGGYIGLFLGYTIREVPSFLRNFYDYAIKRASIQ